jgi:glutamyl-tRNA reductase
MDTVTVDAGADSEEAKAHIRERGARIREAEQSRALDRLRARRDVSEREARVVRELAERLTDALLTVPETHLDAVESGEADPEAAAVALELFGEE